MTSQSSQLHKPLILVYNFILGAAQILQFRGLNDLYEQHIGVGVSDAISATVTSVVILCALRMCSQTVDIPFVLGLDTNKSVNDAFKYTGYHGTSVSIMKFPFLGLVLKDLILYFFMIKSHIIFFVCKMNHDVCFFFRKFEQFYTL